MFCRNTSQTFEFDIAVDKGFIVPQFGDRDGEGDMVKKLPEAIVIERFCQMRKKFIRSAYGLAS